LDEQKNREWNRMNRKQNEYRIKNTVLHNKPVQYQSNSMITRTKSSRDIMGSYYTLKGHPASSQGGQVHSDQMVLEMIRWGRLVQ
jgi:hypothetical protein